MTKRYLFVNGPIYTMDGDSLHDGSITEGGTVLTCGSHIEYVGLRSGLPAGSNDRATVFDLKGRPLFPGFCDGHTHFVMAAGQAALLDLTGTASVEQLQDRIRDRIAAGGTAGSWIEGFGWELKCLFPDRPPSIRVLDETAPGTPLFLMSKDAHSAWLNSCALRQLAKLPDLPEKCTVQKVDGVPTGLVLEDTFELRRLLVPSPGGNEMTGLLTAMLEDFYSHGITSIHNFESVDDYRLLEAFFTGRSLKMRTLWSFAFRNPDELEEHLDVFRSSLEDWLYPWGIKLFMDGALGSRTAALSEPYLHSGDRGILTMEHRELLRWLAVINRHGLRAAFHVIGDRALELLLECLGHLDKQEAGRFRLEHTQILSRQILRRFPSFEGLTFSVQPSHMWGDREIVHRLVSPKLGVDFAYPFRTIRDRGGRLVFGSDAPIEDISPWKGIQAAVTRLEDAATPPWNSSEGLPLYDAISACTRNPAHVPGNPMSIGILRPGCAADMVVLNEDPFRLIAAEPFGLREKMQAVMTMVAGEIVYESQA